MLGTMMLIGIALFITAFLDSRNIIWKIACLISVALLFHIIIVSATRSALIALPFAGAAWLLMMSRKKPLQTIVIILAAIAGAYLFFHSSPGSRFIESMFMQGDGSLDESSLSRLFIWEGGIRHFITTGISGKFTGVGIGAYPTIPYPFVLWGGNRFASGGHLNLLHVLLETGVIGLFLFCWLFWVILRSLWRKRTGNSLAFVLFYCTIGLLGSGLFQETFWFQKAFGSMWMFYSLLVSVALYDDRSRTSG
jgi:O-antigen ligase